jgi:DNA-binding SARP family transcriptional activator
MSLYKRRLITVDPESEDILKVYLLAGYTVSGTIRRALENYYKFNKPKVDPSKFDGVDQVGEPAIVYD